jgi:hypothetical protein
MVVIADTRLIERRLQTLRAERERLAAPSGARAPLPDWAADTLVALGMTRTEIAAADTAAATAPGPGTIAAELADTDAAIETLEEALLARKDRSPDALHALGEIALARLKRSVAVDPGDVAYDVGQARAVALFDQVVRGLARLAEADCRRTR